MGTMAVEAGFYNENMGQIGSVLGINNGEFGYFDLTQEQQQQRMIPPVLDQQQGFQFYSMNNCYQNGAFSYPSTSNGADVETRMGFSQSLGSLLENQKRELGLFLQIQNEGFFKSLVQKYEPYVNTLMSQKEEMITNAIKKRSTLEGYLRNMENEVAMWQVKAQETEAKIAELNNTLNQLSARNGNGDEESHCDSSQSGDDTCKMCRVRRSCVVFLPCRHLCSCKFCEDFVGVCPVCANVKESSVEVFF